MTVTGSTVSSQRQTSGGACVVALVYWTAAALVLTGGVISAVLMFAGQVEWWQGFLAASAITVPSALAGLFPVAVVALRSTNEKALTKIPLAFMAGTMLRLMTAFAILLVANLVYSVPQTPTATLILAFYAVILVTEVSVLVTHLRRMNPLAVASGNKIATGLI